MSSLISQQKLCQPHISQKQEVQSDLEDHLEVQEGLMMDHVMEEERDIEVDPVKIRYIAVRKCLTLVSTCCLHPQYFTSCVLAMVYGLRVFLALWKV